MRECCRNYGNPWNFQLFSNLFVYFFPRTVPASYGIIKILVWETLFSPWNPLNRGNILKRQRRPFMASHLRKRRPLRASLPVLLAAILLAVFLWWDNTSLQVTEADPVFSDLPAGFDGCRIAVLSDLHSASFGPNNQTLFETVARQQPDYIFYLGDLEDQYRGRKPEYVAEVADGLTAIAPTYYVTGNHEWAIGRVPELKEGPRRSRGNGALQPVRHAGQGGDSVVLAGIDDPNGYADQKTPEELAAEVYAACGDPLLDAAGPPEQPLFQPVQQAGCGPGLFRPRPGGLIRLPFTDGLFSHDWDLFPSNTAGAVRRKRLLPVRHPGLGNSGITFRLFNRPEVAMVTLHRA